MTYCFSSPRSAFTPDPSFSFAPTPEPERRAESTSQSQPPENTASAFFNPKPSDPLGEAHFPSPATSVDGAAAAQGPTVPLAASLFGASSDGDATSNNHNVPAQEALVESRPSQAGDVPPPPMGMADAESESVPSLFNAAFSHGPPAPEAAHTPAGLLDHSGHQAGGMLGPPAADNALIDSESAPAWLPGPTDLEPVGPFSASATFVLQSEVVCWPSKLFLDNDRIACT